MIKQKISELAFDTIEVYFDGACSGNPGVGGYGFIIRWIDFDSNGNPSERTIEGSAGYEYTTNNRMELSGALAGLNHLGGLLLSKTIVNEKGINAFTTVKVIGDSSYCTSGFSKGWVRLWKNNNWLTSTKKPVKNDDLWKQLDITVAAIHKEFNLQVKFIHIPGHQGYVFNERCDQLAVNARKGKNLHKDIMYRK